MLKIYIPDNNFYERKYILDVVFDEFLGLDYQISVGSTSDWQIELENGTKIIFVDHFFNKYPKELEYLNESNIPKNIKFIKNDFLVEKDIPVIYGDDDTTISDSEIKCELDIFASSFFMLTRWEEYVNKKRDNHDRFPAIESLAYKFGFLDRPVVNEYVEMLWNMLVYLGYNGYRKNRVFETKVSHDVDHPIHKRYLSFKGMLKSSLGDIIKRKQYFKLLFNLIDYMNYKILKKYKNDSVDTFDFLVDVSEKNGIKSNFYFKTDSTDDVYDDANAGKDRYIKPLMHKISQKGHIIGLHPSYYTYLDLEQTKKENSSLQHNLNSLEIKQKSVGGRQHYLRFAVPFTWQNWEKCSLDYDSTLGYADYVGFRCGTCYEYSVFDFLNRRKLNLKEIPLVVMEGTIFGYMNLNFEDGLELMKSLKDTCRRYNGVFTLLWHNSFFEKEEYFDIYQEIVSY